MVVLLVVEVFGMDLAVGTVSILPIVQLGNTVTVELVHGVIQRVPMVVLLVVEVFGMDLAVSNVQATLIVQQQEHIAIPLPETANGVIQRVPILVLLVQAIHLIGPGLVVLPVSKIPIVICPLRGLFVKTGAAV